MKFEPPVFTSEKKLEVRIVDGEVCIYGTALGLEVLASLCMDAAQRLGEKNSYHIHLEDRECLTDTSCKLVLASFQNR